jgi:GxxExxY protein
MILERTELTEPIISEAISVHRELGPGQPEHAYEEALALGLSTRVSCRTEVCLPVTYSGVRLDCGYRLDLLVNNLVAVELKAVDALMPIHTAQLLTYMRLGGWKTGLLLNFDVVLLKNGIRRVVDDTFQNEHSLPMPDWNSIPERSSSDDPPVNEILAAAHAVHGELGPGLLASAYEACLEYELRRRGICFETDVCVSLAFRGSVLRTTSPLPMLVERRVPVHVCAVDRLTSLQFSSFGAQLRHGGWSIGIILNFNVLHFAAGIGLCRSNVHK